MVGSSTNTQISAQIWNRLFGSKNFEFNFGNPFVQKHRFQGFLTSRNYSNFFLYFMIYLKATLNYILSFFGDRNSEDFSILDML